MNLKVVLQILVLNPCTVLFQIVPKIFCRHIICGLDFTLNPANATLVNTALLVGTSILAMGSCNIAHVQTPMNHKQTKDLTVLKHKRHIEDTLGKHKITLDYPIALLYDRPDDFRGACRSSTQMAFAAVHHSFIQSTPFAQCTAVTDGRIGPMVLAKATDFIDADEAVRPGPADRVEQKLICWFQCDMFFCQCSFCFALKSVWAFVSLVFGCQ